VFITPASYLSFIDNYKKLYTQKLNEIKVKETSIQVGLGKLRDAAIDVENMKTVLAKVSE
jgi:dynein heavy chain